ncbi:coelenterazine h 2-monooxygenase-like [Diadema setosum]|uniref:coelenterazine h 2-monooxygenase-like n=1 Tax=Diadema setosum TaxID=31175 RepID=UPI003B3BAEEB
MADDAINRLQTVVDHLQFGRLAPSNGRIAVRQVAETAGSAVPLVTADEWWGKCRKIKVLGETMSYYDSDPNQLNSRHAVVFLHGNPTSSYLWRNVMPQVQPFARCLAPDLIGMGRSSKLANHSYRFVDHFRYLSAWFDLMNLPRKITIVCHDWGSGLGFHWCHKHQDRLLGLVHMESIVGPVPGWDSFPEVAKNMFQAIRSKAGEEMILDKNLFVELLLPHSILRELRPEEFDAYKEPYTTPGEDRRPTLTWPREIPIVGDGPDDVIAIVSAYHAWLRESASLPKLYINGKPGFFSKGILRGTQNWPNQKVVECAGLHFLQEDSPIEIGNHIKDFVLDLYK